MPSTDRDALMNDLCLIIGYDRGIVGRQAVMILESDIERLADLITQKQKEARQEMLDEFRNWTKTDASDFFMVIESWLRKKGRAQSPDREEDKR